MAQIKVDNGEYEGGFPMNIKTLEERIQKAEEKISKKQTTIIKKEGWIEKKSASLAKLDESERKWAEYDIKSWTEDIKRIQSEIAETRKTIEKYQKQLDGEIAREKSWVSEVPEVLKSFQNKLVETWDKHDIRRQQMILEDCKTLSYREQMDKYGWREVDWARYTTEDQIHASNERDAISLILNLVNRVKDITGEITDWDHLSVATGTWGMTVLNGWVIGKEGRCCVESIGAGGYNIQRYHIRVLVKPY